MTEEQKPRKRGRPPRVSEPLIIRGTVPDNHPLHDTLKAMGPGRAAMLLLEIAANRLTPSAPAAPSLGLHPGEPTANLIPQAVDPSESLLQFDDDMADLLNFSGGTHG